MTPKFYACHSIMVIGVFSFCLLIFRETWIRSMVEEFFPDAQQILDYFHRSVLFPLPQSLTKYFYLHPIAFFPCGKKAFYAVIIVSGFI